MESSPTMRSLGDVLAPFAKKRKPKPKNPNAVQQFKNRRTEMANKERNNAANGKSGLSFPDSYSDDPWESPDLRRMTSTPLVLFDDNVLKREELPPPRSKPLPRDIKILLAVLGTVGAIIFLFYIAKKIFYDKIHKNKSGKISHAYAHFRRFKKKRKSRSNHKTRNAVETVCEVETKMSQSSESGLGTMNANEVAANENYQANGSTPHSKCTVSLFSNLPGPPGRLEDGFKNIPPVKRNATQVPLYGKQHTNVTSRPPANRRYPSDSSSSDQERSHRRRKRRRRRKSSSQAERIRDEQIIHQRATRGHSEHGRDNNCTFVVKDDNPANDSRYYRKGRSKFRVEKQVLQSSHLSKDEIGSSSVSDADQMRSKSSNWRDRAYS